MSEAQKQLDTRMGDYVPERLHVARQTRGDDTIVGFAVPINGDEKWSSERARKADAWATSGYGRTQSLPSMQIDNDWYANFTMIKQVRRSESDAVYWRVLHPLGFEFEMSLANFEYFLNKYNLDQGLITVFEDGELKPVNLKLIYHKSNTKWTLVDDEHPTFVTANNNIIPGTKEHLDLVAQAKADEKAARQTLEPGNQIKWGSDTATFLGTMSVGFGELKDPQAQPTIKRMKVLRIVRQNYRNQNQQTTEYHFLNQLQVHKIHQQTKMSADDALAEVSHALNNPKCSIHGNPMYFEVPRNSSTPVAVWAKKPKKIEHTLEVVDLKDIIGTFVPNLRVTNSHHKLEHPLRLQLDDDWHNHYEPVVPNLMLRKKGTSELIYIKQVSTRHGYGTYDHDGFNYGNFRVQTPNGKVELARYADHRVIIERTEHQLPTIRQLQQKGEQLTRFQQMTLDRIEDAINAKNEELADKQWHYTDEYELIHVKVS